MIFRVLSYLVASLILMSMSWVSADSTIGDVTVQFCNDSSLTTQLNLVMDAGTSSDICVQFTNNSISDVMIKAGFIDGTMTEDTARTKACKNEGEVTRFGQYVQFDTKPFLLPAGVTLEKQATLRFPSGYNGLIYGCLTYYLSKSNDIVTDGNSMFNVLVRKANFVNVLLGGKLERNLVDTIGGIGNISPRIDPISKHLVAEIALENKGNVIENVTLSGSISNVFGYYNAFTGNVLKIQGEDKGVLKIDMGKVPFYKGWYTIDMTLISVPTVEFALDIPAEMNDPLVIQESLTVFFVPYLVIIIIILLILVIWLLKRLFSKFRFVAVAPPSK